VDAVKQQLDVCGRLHLYSNTQRLDAFSAVRDTYTRNKENGMSEKAGVHMRQELSSSGVRRRQEQSVVKQRGIMHSYIEFAHVVCLVALPEHYCVQ